MRTEDGGSDTSGLATQGSKYFVEPDPTSSILNPQSVPLRSVSLRNRGSMPAGFPFDVPVVRQLETLELSTAVTFFVGENGSGKSTLLEAMALAADLPTVGSDETRDDTTLTAQRALARHLTLSWTSRSKRGFFLRAEDFFGYAKRLSRMKSEMREEIARIELEYEGRSEYARGLAMGPALASLGALDGQYGGDLDGRSHGQSFLTLFQARFIPGGLHLLDEPEAPLSPQSAARVDGTDARHDRGGGPVRHRHPLANSPRLPGARRSTPSTARRRSESPSRTSST